MPIKKRFQSISNSSAIENLANELADKPYGQNQQISESLTRTTLTLPSSLLIKLEDLARDNKRKKLELKSVSAIIRECIENYLKIK